MNPQPTAKLRVLGDEDVSLVHDLEQHIFPEDPWTIGMIAEELSSSYRRYFAAEIEGSAVGYAGISLLPDGDIMTIGVLPAQRGQGIGALLMEAMMSAAREANCARVFLEVRASNVGAQRLYERYGFRAVGRTKNYFRNPIEDAVTMRWVK